MKLAEGLISRADIKNKIAVIQKRLAQNIKVEEGEEPIEDAKKLLKEYNALMGELEKIIKRINKTNAAVKIGDVILADSIVERDSLKAKIRAYRDLIEKATSLKERGYGSETTKYVRCIDIHELQKQADDLSKKYRELDVKIQGKNWTVDLLSAESFPKPDDNDLRF